MKNNKNEHLAREFMRLFAGLDRVHGRYVVPSSAKPNTRGKVEGKGWTAHEPLTLGEWEAHLTGNPVTVSHGDEKLTGTLGIGVVPIRDDSTCVFGAGDIDQYDPPLDLPALSAEARELGLPLILCRTKSGGAHFYLFLTEPAPAELVRLKLMEWMLLLGFPGVEVFPKQTRLANAEDEGNWINMPYNGPRSTRYALGPDDQALTAEEFVAYATARAVTPAWLEAFKPEVPASDEDDLLFEGPPCLQLLAKRGMQEPGRNNAMFSICVYLKKRYGDEWGEHAAAYNERFMDPPLPDRELQQTVKSVEKKRYSYKCKDHPLVEVCNRQLCLTREHGVGGLGDDPGVLLGELTKIETQPPVWVWEVDGARLELATNEVMDQRGFHARVIDVLNKWPQLVRPGTWQEIVRTRLARAQTVIVPEDATKEGQLWVHLSKFCTSRVVGRSLDELLLGKPFTDEKNRRTFFCSSDFLQYLQQHRVTGVTEKDLFRWLRRKDVQHHFSQLKGKGVSYWSVPAFDKQTEEHAVPRAPVETM